MCPVFTNYKITKCESLELKLNVDISTYALETYQELPVGWFWTEKFKFNNYKSSYTLGGKYLLIKQHVAIVYLHFLHLHMITVKVLFNRIQPNKTATNGNHYIMDPKLCLNPPRVKRRQLGCNPWLPKIIRFWTIPFLYKDIKKKLCSFCSKYVWPVPLFSIYKRKKKPIDHRW